MSLTSSEDNPTSNINPSTSASTGISENENENTAIHEQQHHQQQPLHDIMECQICISLICEPITLTCGHSFCRVCLMQCFRKLKKQCMICRQVCDLIPDSASENIMIRNLAMSVHPTVYACRKAEVEGDKAALDTMLPVFSGCRDEIFPGHTLLLNLFEPRYKLMMRRIGESAGQVSFFCGDCR